MSYVELRPPAEVAHTVACLWTQQVTAPEQRVVPDGCVDVIWMGGRLWVAGASTGPVRERLHVGDLAIGVRLRPEAAAAVLGYDATQLRDRRVDATELWGDGLATRLSETEEPMRALLEGLHARQAEPDRLVARAARLLAEDRVGEVARTLGVSERQLQRRVTRSVGIGPKTLARVARLRRLERSRGALAQRALEAGYASQAHMGDEVRRLTGLTPATYLAA